MPKLISRDFPGSPVVRTSSSNIGVAGSVAGQGPKIPHASGPKKQNVKQEQLCNKFSKDFKNEPYQKIYVYIYTLTKNKTTIATVILKKNPRSYP